MIGKLNRVAGRVKSRLSPVIIAIITATALAGLLITIDFLLADDLLLAAATVLLTGVGLVMAWKTYAISLGIKELRKRPVAAAAAPAPATAATQRSVQDKLRHVGDFTPNKASGSVAGRQAAAVTVDADAPFRLYAATQRGSDSGQAGRSIVLVGSDELADTLAKHGTVARLHPSMSAAEVAKADPDVIVIDEAAGGRPLGRRA